MSGDPFSHNGGGVVAMLGRDCVALAGDLRLGVGFQTVATGFPKVFVMQHNLLLGLAGLATDVQTLHALLARRLALYRLRENRDMPARTFISLVGTTLYEHRFAPFFVTPAVVGLQDGRPLLCTYDSIGTQSVHERFAAAGTAAGNFVGLCESYHRKGLGREELGDVLANVLVSGLDRDVLAGWGGVLYVMDTERIDIKTLKTKMV